VEEFVKLNQEIHGGSFGGSDRDAVFEKNTSGKGLNGKSNGEQSIPVAMKMIGETLFPFLFLFFHVGNGSGNGKTDGKTKSILRDIGNGTNRSGTYRLRSRTCQIRSGTPIYVTT
jgi:hypothetical protein